MNLNHLTEDQKALIEAFWSVGAIKIAGVRGEPEGGYKTKFHDKYPGAPLSTYYLNLRTDSNPKPGPLTPELIMLIGEILTKRLMMADLRPGWLIGIPNAGEPFADAIGKSLDIAQLRLKKMGRGKNRRIVRLLKVPRAPNRSVVFVDDVLSEASTKFEAVNVVREHFGLALCNNILVLVNRLQGGRERLARFGVNVFSALTMADIFAHLCQCGLISEGEMHRAMAYPALIAGYKIAHGIE